MLTAPTLWFIEAESPLNTGISVVLSPALMVLGKAEKEIMLGGCGNGAGATSTKAWAVMGEPETGVTVSV